MNEHGIKTGKATKDLLVGAVRVLRRETGRRFQVYYGDYSGGVSAFLALDDQAFSRRFRPPALLKFIRGFLAGIQWAKEGTKGGTP
ncbi:MAG: hypothetical protein V2A73_17425 [Pseudomonadota bacterium]